MFITYLVTSLTGAVGVDHETPVDVVLDEQKSLLEDLTSTRLLHCVGVTWIPEKSQQLSWSTRLTEGMRDRVTGCKRGGEKLIQSQRRRDSKYDGHAEKT